MNNIRTLVVSTLISIVAFFSIIHIGYAATLRVSPDTGVYTTGSTFTANVVLNTQGKPVNAADGQLSFNPRELTVVSVSRAGSIFNLWTEEPSFSNSAGTISFGGGSPTGYTGSGGTILSITLRPTAAGNPKLTFKSGSVLAADGLGTNVLTAMNGGAYTISAQAENPEPEYIAPANTPKAPVVTSTTHPDQTAWYKETTAELTWGVPSDVTAVRTLLDNTAGTIPTIVYEEALRKKTLTDLPQGVSYFHIQFKNAEGWGKVAHVRLGVDTEAPSAFTIAEIARENLDTPTRTLVFTITDVSPILKYRIQIDGGEFIEYADEKGTKQYTLPILPPGRHTVIVEAFDSAGNSRAATYSFDVSSFEKPFFTEYPERISPEVIPALKGTTRPNATVEISLTRSNGVTETYIVTAIDSGVFTFIPDSRLEVGVYDISAVATDSFGAVSEPSDTLRIIVEEPGYLRVGSFMVSVLSVIVPLLALLVLLVFGCWYSYHRLSLWRKKVQTETHEIEDVVKSELDTILTNLHANVAELKESRKGKFTRAESTFIEQIEEDVASARAKIRKEIIDVEHIVE